MNKYGRHQIFYLLYLMQLFHSEAHQQILDATGNLDADL